MDVRTRQAGFLEVMRRFPTGVTIVATMGPDAEPAGLTVSSFTSVSLDPPLVLVCVDRTSDTHDRLVDGSGFAISVLSAGQADVALRFAAEPAEGRFDVAPWRGGPKGQPIICGAAAWLECATHEILPGGDHSIVLGRVEASGIGDELSMVYHGGVFGSMGS
jgi:flavin-dependent trigonelline monooxygenase, reductase component